MKGTAKVSITWDEELVDRGNNFYVRLKPQITYRLAGADAMAKYAAQTILDRITKGVKGKNIRKK